MKFLNIKSECKENLEIIRAFFAQYHFWRYFFTLVIIYLIAYSALFRADIYFRDDLWRSYNEIHWNEFSRFGATFLFNLFSVFKFVDISPLTQILAFILLALSSLVIIYASNHKLNIFNVLALAPLTLSPFYAEVMSYRFDSLTISFSVFFAVLPFLFARKIQAFALISLVSLVLMYSTYQASSGVYLVVGLYLALRIYLERGFKDSIKFLIALLVPFILASLFYKVFIVVSVPVTSYVSDSMLLPRYFLPGILRNVAVYLFNLLHLLTFMPVLYMLVGLCLFFVFGAINENPDKKLKAFFASLLFIICALCLSYGAYLVLERPLMAARSFIGFGAFMSVVALYCVNFQARFPKILSRTLIICAVYSLIVFLNAYGNAISAQEKYVYFRNSIALEDLNTYATNYEMSGLSYIGRIGYSPQTQRFFDIYGGMAEELVPSANANLLWWFARLKGLRMPYDLFTFNEFLQLTVTDCHYVAPMKEERHLLVSSVYHDIYETEGVGEIKRCYMIVYHDLDD